MQEFIKKYKYMIGSIGLFCLIGSGVFIINQMSEMSGNDAIGGQTEPDNIVDESGSYSEDLTVNKDQDLTNVKSYQLGETEIKTFDGEVLKVPLIGKIAVPASEAGAPIVFLIPGSEQNEFLDSLYDSILDEMAKLNYLGVLVDMSEVLSQNTVDPKAIKQVFNEHRIKLTEALLGENTLDGIELSNKGTLADAVFISYGDSLESVYQIIDDQMSKQQLNLDSLLFINPVRLSDQSFAFPDVLTTFLIDGVLGQEQRIGSQKLYEEYRQEKSRKSMTSYLLVEDASFNQQVKIASGEEKIPLNTGLMSSEETLTLLVNYVSDFLHTTFDGQRSESGFSELNEETIEISHPNIISSSVVPNMLRLINPTIELNPTVNTLGGDNVLSNLSITHDVSYLSTFKFDISDYPASFIINLPSTHKDLSQYETLSLYLAFN
ncbi:MAG: hypothetical protein ACRCST_10575, partial [Turicibacter sp.]